MKNSKIFLISICAIVLNLAGCGDQDVSEPKTTVQETTTINELSEENVVKIEASCTCVGKKIASVQYMY